MGQRLCASGEDRPSDSLVDRHTLFQCREKEKISRGDIVGFLIAKGGLEASQIGRIALRDHAALVAVPRSEAGRLVKALAPERIKNTRAKISVLKGE